MANTYDTESEPRILLFRILPTFVKGEQWYEYNWEISDAKYVSLFRDGEQKMSREDARAVSRGGAKFSRGWPVSMTGLRTKLSGVTRFELVATGYDGQSVSKKFTVKAAADSGSRPAPDRHSGDKEKYGAGLDIKSFKITPGIVTAGDTISFHWNVENADSVRLFDDLGEIDLRSRHRRGSGMNSFFSSTIGQTTTFRLLASNRKGEKVSRRYTVKVKPGQPVALNIKSFYVTPAVSRPGGSITFHWEVINADSVELYDDIGEMDLRSSHKRNGGMNSSVSTTINKTTRFRLDARNRTGESSSKTFTAKVIRWPGPRGGLDKYK